MMSSWSSRRGGPAITRSLGNAAAQGVRYVVCEKPLADSLYDGWRMLRVAEEARMALGVNHTLRFLGVDAGIQELAGEYALGEPRSAVIHGGASGLVTNGIHFVDLAMAVFKDTPISVVSTAVGESINPRSPELKFYGGTAVWSFRGQREVVISFSNQSSVFPTATFYYRDGVIHLHNRTHAAVLSRDAGSLAPNAPVTRTGPATHTLYQGPVPGILDSIESAFVRHYDEIVAGDLGTFRAEDAYRALEACIAALIASERGERVSLPLDPESEYARRRWGVS